MKNRIPEAVTIGVAFTEKLRNPGRVGRKGWWNSTLREDEFVVKPDLAPWEASPEDPEAKPRQLCERLGLTILSVEVLPDPVESN